MNAKDILARRFEKANFNGYKTDDVDEFLREISNEFSQLQKDKSELERKLEVLADKIREYREDEDALKDALLLAQKQGKQIVGEAKDKAEKLVNDAQSRADKLDKDSKERSEKMIRDADDYAKRMTRDSNERADKLVKDARAKAEEIHALMQRQTEIQQSILQKTRKEVDEYRNRLLLSYKAHIEYIEKLPEKCENEFIKAASAEAEKREAEREKAAAVARAAKKKPIGIADNAKPAAEEKPAAAPVQKNPDESAAKDPKSAPAEPDKVGGDTTEIPNSPFFNPASENKPKRTDLQFGKNK